MNILNIQYKEDRFSDMIRQTAFNPFRLTVEPIFNSGLQFGDMVDIFANELDALIGRAQSVGIPITEAFSGYLFNCIEDYFNKAGFVPKAIADTIIEQVYAAVRKTKYSNRIIDSLDDVKYVMYYNLTHR